jgi:hypothetical protein
MFDDMNFDPVGDARTIEDAEEELRESEDENVRLRQALRTIADWTVLPNTIAAEMRAFAFEALAKVGT